MLALVVSHVTWPQQYIVRTVPTLPLYSEHPLFMISRRSSHFLSLVIQLFSFLSFFFFMKLSQRTIFLAIEQTIPFTNKDLVKPVHTPPATSVLLLVHEGCSLRHGRESSLINTCTTSASIQQIQNIALGSSLALSFLCTAIITPQST